MNASLPQVRAIAAEPRTTCRVTDGVLRPCPDLDDCLEDSGDPTTRGLIAQVAFCTVRKSVQMTHVEISSGMHVPRGLLARFCPFCGADIGSHLHAR